MYLRRHALAFALLSITSLAASPTTQHADPLITLAANVAAKASGQSVVLILRPDSISGTETPTAIAAIRDAALHAMQTANINLTTSDTAGTVLRDQATAGTPTVPVVVSVLAAAKTDLALFGIVHRAGDSHKIAFTLMGPKGSLTQMSVVLSAKSIASTGDDVDLASAAIASAIKPAAQKCIDPIQIAGVKTLLVAVEPKAAADPATAAFEMALYDSISSVLQENKLEVKSLGSTIAPAALQPATVAKLKDPPADSAVMLVTYTRKPGGTSVKISVVSSTAKLATESAGIDNWDVAAMPAFPVLNTRVLAYAESQRGTKVGNGECWTLAAEALKDAQAKHANGYTFGRKLLPGEPIYPGEIMQFTEAKFEGHTGNSTWWMTLGSPNHTAVVRRVLGPTKYEILEQNPGPVKAATIDFKDLKSGKWETWRPQGH